MTCQTQDTQFDLAMELLIEHGFGGVASAMSILLNAAMRLERSRYLKAEPYERNEHRRGYANGYKLKTVKTKAGEIQLAIPQTRDSRFYPSSLQRGLRSDRALKIALAEMYVQGVSTRKVDKITENMLERLNKEIKRRIRVATLFPDSVSCLRRSLQWQWKSRKSGRQGGDTSMKE